MYQLQTKDKVRHPSVAVTMVVREVKGDRVECGWEVGDEAVTGFFIAEELEHAPESVKGLAIAAVRNGYAVAATARGTVDAPPTVEPSSA